MAKFVIGGSFGFGFGAAGSSKKNWFSRLIGKISGKQPEAATEEQPHEKVSGKAAGGLGGCNLQYSIECDLTIAEMRELYEITHKDEEWSFDRSVSEIKALGRGIKNLINRFISDEGRTINAAWDVACSVYEHCKRRDHETCQLDHEIQLDNFKSHLEQEREMDRLRREDARIRAEEAEKEEKAKK